MGREPRAADYGSATGGARGRPSRFRGLSRAAAIPPSGRKPGRACRSWRDAPPASRHLSPRETSLGPAADRASTAPSDATRRSTPDLLPSVTAILVTKPADVNALP